MCDLGSAFDAIGNLFTSPSLDTFQAAAPLLLPAAGAGIGALAGGGKGALIGGLSGLAGGQLIGTGPNTIGSVFGIPQSQSVLGSLINPSGAGAGGGYAAAATAAGPTDPFGFGGVGLGSNASGTLPTGNVGPTSFTTGGAGAADLGGAGGGGGSGGDFFSNLINKNPGALLGAGVIGAEALRGNKLPEIGPIQKQASELAQQGRTLTAPLTTGVLPQGAQAAVDQAVKANQAAIRSEFANMGLTGSTMETTALNEAALRGTQLGFQIAQQMAQTGLSELGISSDLLVTIANAQLQNDNALSQSIANFAAAIAGGGKGLNITLPQSTTVQ